MLSASNHTHVVAAAMIKVKRYRAHARQGIQNTQDNITISIVLIEKSGRQELIIVSGEKESNFY